MPQPLNFMCALGVALSTVVTPPALAQAQSQAENPVARSAPGAPQRIVGAWQLVTRSVRKDNGEMLVDPVLGQQPLGRLYYDASGGVMLQMMRIGRTGAIGKPANPEDAANPRVVLGYDAYFGTYTVNEAQGTVTHHVQASLFPEDLGKDFVRPFTLEGDTLTLSFTSPSAGGSPITRTLTFRRSQ
jgi:lipocalin-like protein